MANRLNPYITFAGTARAAMTFYQGIFGGELHLNTFGEYGDDSPTADNVMHGMLETPGGFTLMGADNPPGMDVTVGDNISVSLSGDGADELRGYFAKLSESGSVTLPLEVQMWGDEFGMCTDQFGINWMVNITTS